MLLAAYREWGRDCVERFVGMWAFALLDTRAQTLLLSRDRFGIKPLYWARLGDGLVFASEIKALLAAGVAREPDERVVRRYLLTGRVDETPATFFAAIRQLPPAHDAVVDLREPAGRAAPAALSGRRPHRPRRDARRPTTPSGSPRCCATRYASTRAATCPSGAASAAAWTPRPSSASPRSCGAPDAIPSYTHRGISYVPGDAELSERPFMAAVARRTGIAMTYVEPSVDDVVAGVPAIVRQQDEPFGSASIAAQWFVFRAAREAGLTVMLDGQGADEYLAGYLGFLRVQAADLAARRRGAGARRGWRSTRAGAPARWPIGGREALGLALNGRNGAAGEPPPAIELMGAELRRDAEPADWTVEPPAALEDTLRRHLTRDRAAGAAALRGPQLDGALDRGPRAAARPPPGRVRAGAADRVQAARRRDEVGAAAGARRARCRRRCARAATRSGSAPSRRSPGSSPLAAATSWSPRARPRRSAGCTRRRSRR